MTDVCRSSGGLKPPIASGQPQTVVRTVERAVADALSNSVARVVLDLRVLDVNCKGQTYAV